MAFLRIQDRVNREALARRLPELNFADDREA